MYRLYYELNNLFVRKYIIRKGVCVSFGIFLFWKVWVGVIVFYMLEIF